MPLKGSAGAAGLIPTGIYNWWEFPAEGTITLNGQVLDVGSSFLSVKTTGADLGILVTSTQNGATGARIQGVHASASPAGSDVVMRVMAQGRKTGGAAADYAFVDFRITDPDASTPVGEIYWWCANGAANNVMRVSGAGALSVDINSGVTYIDTNHPITVFDELDDALVLREGIGQGGLDRLCDIGVVHRKDSGSGYMLRVQAMMYLLAGGIYQNRARIDDLADVLAEEFPQIVGKLAERHLLTLASGGN